MKDKFYMTYFKGVDVDIFPVNYKELIYNKEFIKYLNRIYDRDPESKIKIIEEIIEKFIQKDKHIYLFGYHGDITATNKIVECKSIEEFLKTATIINIISPEAIFNLDKSNCVIETTDGTIIKNTRSIYFKNMSWISFGMGIDFANGALPTLKTNVHNPGNLRGLNLFSLKLIKIYN